MIERFKIGKGQTAPVLRGTVERENDATYDISAASAVFRMWDAYSREVVIDDAAATSRQRDQATVRVHRLGHGDARRLRGRLHHHVPGQLHGGGTRRGLRGSGRYPDHHHRHTERLIWPTGTRRPYAKLIAMLADHLRLVLSLSAVIGFIGTGLWWAFGDRITEAARDLVGTNEIKAELVVQGVRLDETRDAVRELGTRVGALEPSPAVAEYDVLRSTIDDVCYPGQRCTYSYRVRRSVEGVELRHAYRTARAGGRER
jgi:hypothetical protein